MSTKTLVSVEEYLTTSYSPDVDYVDGVLEDRNVGEKDHSFLQMAIGAYLFQRRKQLGIHVYPEQRIRISGRRYRVPDLCVVAGTEPDEQVFTRAPFLCVEILSPEDRIGRMESRVEDYLRLGVSYVWVVNPQTRKATIYTRNAVTVVKDGILRTVNPDISIPIAELFD